MISIKEKLFKEMVKHCQEEYPYEACGILAGKEGKVSKVYEMVNGSDKPEICYFMEPAEQLRVFKEMRSAGMEIMGIYHSHVKTHAYPSKRDCEMAFYPEASHVIISLENPKGPDVRAFRIVKNKAKSEKITIE